MNEALENDINIFNQIIENTKEIATIYEKIFLMECLDDKNSNIYNELILQLEVFTKTEVELYRKLNLTVDKKDKLKEYLVTVANVNNIDIDYLFAASCNENTKDLWFYRISSQLEEYTENIDEIDEDDTFMMEAFLEKELIENYLKESKYTAAINEDFKQSFMYFLQSEIDNCEDTSMRFNLLLTRYNLSYVSPSLEKSLIQNKFCNLPDLYFTFPMVAQELELEKEYSDNIQKEAVYAQCLSAISDLNSLLLMDEEMEKYKNKNSKILSIYFRAGLSLLYNHNNYNEIFDGIMLQISEHETTEGITDFIDGCVNKSKQDRLKCKYLTIGRR